MPDGVVNQVLEAVTGILEIKGGKTVATATGFFYSKNDKVFLVTNRHVVLGQEPNPKPEAFKLLLHADSNDLTKNVWFDVPLYSKSGSPNFRFPKDSPVGPIDVAVVAVDQSVKRLAIKALSADLLPPKDLILQPGDDLLVVGFPRGFSDGVHNLPIVRRGMLSTPYGVDFDGLPAFLVDGNLQPGTSGSPVLTPYRTAWNKPGGTVISGAIYFLGIHSATLSTNQPQGPEPLGLATAWYAQAIEDVVAAWK